jgi:hypothetical protein
LEANDIIAGRTIRVFFDGTYWRIIARGGVPLPARHLSTRTIYLNTDPITKLRFLAPDQFWSLHLSSATSKPTAYTIEGDQYIFGPAYDASYQGRITYYRRLPRLTSDSDTNWRLENNTGLYLYGLLTHINTLIKNVEAVTFWSALFDDLADVTAEANHAERFSGSPLTTESLVPHN